MNRAWHADEAAIDGYLAGRIGLGPSASIETHLMSCASCRELLTSRTAPRARAVIGSAWSGIRDKIATPPLPLVLRVLRRFGLAEDTAVLLAAARSMSTAWTLATVVVLSFAAASLPLGVAGQAVYLIVAPLVPVAGVVASFGPAHDPFAELTRSTPYPAARLILLRALAVAVTSVPFAVAIGLAVPGTLWLAFVWLVPALAFMLLVLAAATWVDPLVAGGTLALGWATVVGEAARTGLPTAPVAGFAQVVYLGIAAVAAVLLVWRIRRSGVPGGIV